MRSHINMELFLRKQSVSKTLLTCQRWIDLSVAGCNRQKLRPSFGSNTRWLEKEATGGRCGGRSGLHRIELRQNYLRTSKKPVWGEQLKVTQLYSLALITSVLTNFYYLNRLEPSKDSACSLSNVWIPSALVSRPFHPIMHTVVNSRH